MESDMTLRLDGKIALITGAAQGIGASSARIMAEQGATVVLADINEDAAHAQAEKLKSTGATAMAIKVDARDKASILDMIAKTHTAYGRLDILHNNAGGTYMDRDTQAVDISDDTWREVFAWNIDGVHWATQAAIPLMLPNGGGSIINTSSGGGMFALSTMTAFGAAKAALISYTRYVAVCYGRRGIRCNSIAPGFIATPHAVDAMPPEFQKACLEPLTTPRVGIPDDIGYLAAFLASEASGYMNGLTIPVDGGGSIRALNDTATLAIGGYGPGVPAPESLPIVP
jgi:NAD(P)-dependent dehydrogenase (short-subunit alcohol dehydrogenase family)